MIKRVVFAGIVVLALMIAVKDGRLTRDIGLAGACTVAQTLTDGSQVEACRAGRLAGRPDLRRQGCVEAGVSGTYAYWRCPSSVVSDVATR
jgi:hypothetical protein